MASWQSEGGNSDDSKRRRGSFGASAELRRASLAETGHCEATIQHIEDVINLFRVDDDQNSGIISLMRLNEVCRHLGHNDEEITTALSQYRETHGDGRGGGIDYEEFVAWLFGENIVEFCEHESLSSPTLQPGMMAQQHSLTQTLGAHKHLAWDRAVASAGGKKHNILNVAAEAVTITNEGVTLEVADEERDLSPDELARSYLRFSPSVLMHMLHNAEFEEANVNQPIVKPFRVALMLIDVSGFTRMSVKLGAELTRKHTSKFFDKIIQCIIKHGGDVLKFLGDALLVAWPTDYLASPFQNRMIAVAAAACSAEIMKTMNGYVVTDDVSLTLHGGLTIGDVWAFDVGNSLRREFLIGGPLLVEIGDLESEAKSGEMVMSKAIASFLPESAGRDYLDSGGIKLNLDVDLESMLKENSLVTVIADHLSLQFGLDCTTPMRKNELLHFQKHYSSHMEAHVPPSCREHVRHSALNNLGEMRHVTTLFLSLDFMVPYLNSGRAKFVQACFLVIIEATRYTGGAVRQFVLDDKGCVAILAWGIHRAAHGSGQDATRAMQCAFHIYRGLNDSPVFEEALRNRTLGPKIGIAAGTVYVGLVGAQKRCEYAMVGPSVNLAARLMGKAKTWNVLCEEVVHDFAVSTGVELCFRYHPPVQAKGYDHDVHVYVVEPQERQRIQATHNLLDELIRAWRGMELRVQLIGKVASVLAIAERLPSKGCQAEIGEFPMLALVNIVSQLKLATYAETKAAMNLLHEIGFIRISRRGGKGANPPCVFTDISVHNWVYSLVTEDHAHEVRALLKVWANKADADYRRGSLFRGSNRRQSF